MFANGAIVSIKRNRITAHCDGSCSSFWVCSQHTRMGGRSAVSHGCEPLQKFPHISSSPRPHILPPLFPCFPHNSGNSEKQAARKNSREYGRAFVPVPRGCSPLVRSAARLLTGLCAVPVVKEGVGLAGIAPWEAFGRREAKASFGRRCYGPLGLNWDELPCSLAASWRSEDYKINCVACN